jgi:hypothetical protein
MANERQPGPGWEEELRQGLDTISHMDEEEAPPSLAALQMLVADVRREERRRVLRELTLFWACAAVLLAAAMAVLARRPLYFLGFEAAAGLLLLVGALLWPGMRGQVGRS